MKPVDHQRTGLRRSRPATPFSSLMEPYLGAHACVQAMVFVDQDGECIDYASRLDPDEAMIMAATWLVPTRDVAVSMTRLGAGSPVWWMVETDAGHFVVRRVSEEHLVLVVLSRGGVLGPVLECLQPLAEDLRAEAGLSAPAWDSLGERVRVDTRRSKTWGYAPARIHDGREPRTLDVLGRVSQRRAFARPVTLFRVRRGDAELTLAHCSRSERWYRR